MYQRTIKLSVGSNATGGDASALIDRIENDLEPLVEPAYGLIVYAAVKVDDQTVITTRVFHDFASLNAAQQATNAVSNQVATDFDLSLEPLIDGEVNVGVAHDISAVYQP